MRCEPGPQRSPHDRFGQSLAIGIVNNMPDAALRSTERQFRELLADAARGLAVTMRFFFLPGLIRSADGWKHLQARYESIDELWVSELDGLIVTGTQPKAAELAHEPYWPMLRRLVDWAAAKTSSTIWSCLAAHAAVEHLDGVRRQSFAEKLSGVFEARKQGPHPILDGVPTLWFTPHSRHNDLAQPDLAACGYQILGRSADAGVDVFVKNCGSLFLFLQGHPEYDAGALLREYRRDVGRFLTGAREFYPRLPHRYFGGGTISELRAFRERALCRRDPALLGEFPIGSAQQDLRAPWRDTAIRFYANWLAQLRRAKFPYFRSHDVRPPARGAQARG